MSVARAALVPSEGCVAGRTLRQLGAHGTLAQTPPWSHQSSALTLVGDAPAALWSGVRQQPWNRTPLLHCDPVYSAADDACKPSRAVCCFLPMLPQCGFR